MTPFDQTGPRNSRFRNGKYEDSSASRQRNLRFETLGERLPLANDILEPLDASPSDWISTSVDDQQTIDDSTIDKATDGTNPELNRQDLGGELNQNTGDTTPSDTDSSNSDNSSDSDLSDDTSSDDTSDITGREVVASLKLNALVEVSVESGDELVLMLPSEWLRSAAQEYGGRMVIDTLSPAFGLSAETIDSRAFNELGDGTVVMARMNATETGTWSVSLQASSLVSSDLETESSRWLWTVDPSSSNTILPSDSSVDDSTDPAELNLGDTSDDSSDVSADQPSDTDGSGSDVDSDTIERNTLVNVTSDTNEDRTPTATMHSDFVIRLRRVLSQGSEEISLLSPMQLVRSLVVSGNDGGMVINDLHMSGLPSLDDVVSPGHTVGMGNVGASDAGGIPIEDTSGLDGGDTGSTKVDSDNRGTESKSTGTSSSAQTETVNVSKTPLLGQANKAAPLQSLRTVDLAFSSSSSDFTSASSKETSGSSLNSSTSVRRNEPVKPFDFQSSTKRADASTGAMKKWKTNVVATQLQSTPLLLVNDWTADQNKAVPPSVRASNERENSLASKQKSNQVVKQEPAAKDFVVPAAVFQNKDAKAEPVSNGRESNAVQRAVFERSEQAGPQSVSVLSPVHGGFGLTETAGSEQDVAHERRESSRSEGSLSWSATVLTGIAAIGIQQLSVDPEKTKNVLQTVTKRACFVLYT